MGIFHISESHHFPRVFNIRLHLEYTINIKAFNDFIGLGDLCFFLYIGVEIVVSSIMLNVHIKMGYLCMYI